jgi:hypothetical protein
MNFFTRSTALFSCALAFSLTAASSFAVTVKYEVENLQSNNGWISYPGLDFSNATSATLSVEKDSPGVEPRLKSLDITFPNAAKLSAKDFKKVDGFIYRAVVDDAWIYRQVIVDLHGADFNNPNGYLTIDVAVSERQGFINPENEERGEHILLAHGQLKDVTTSKVVDTGSAVVNGKRANLSLKSRLGVPAPEAGSGEGGFAIDVLWLGRGEKTIYLPSGFPQQHFDFITPIRLVLEDLTSPDGPMIRVVAKDDHGYEISNPPFRLKQLLDQAYGPLLP